MPKPPIDWDRLTPEERQAMVQSLLEVDKKNQRVSLEDIPTSTKFLALLGLPAESNPTQLERSPLITYFTIVLCCAVSYLCFHDPELLTTLALYPSEFWRSGGLTLLSCFFVHGGWLHLLSNMYCLFVFGDNVEDVLGRMHYVWLLICATLLGSILSISIGGMDPVAHVGASGGVFGVMVYYLLRFRRAKFTYVVFFQFFQVPAILVLGIYAFSQFTGVLQQLHGVGQVDALAHIGGGLAGFFFWLRDGRPRDEAPSSHLPWV